MLLEQLYNGIQLCQTNYTYLKNKGNWSTGKKIKLTSLIQITM